MPRFFPAGTSITATHRRAEELVDVEQLAQARGFGVDHVVGEHHGERLISHQFHGPQHGVAQPQSFFLARVGHVDHVRNVTHDRKQIFLAARFEHVLQLEADVEMILDGALAAAGDDDDVLNPGMQGLLDAILDEGFIHQGQHFLGLRFGGGKEAGAQTGGREDRFANLGGHYIYSLRSPIANSNWQMVMEGSFCANLR